MTVADGAVSCCGLGMLLAQALSVLALLCAADAACVLSEYSTAFECVVDREVCQLFDEVAFATDACGHSVGVGDPTRF